MKTAELVSVGVILIFFSSFMLCDANAQSTAGTNRGKQHYQVTVKCDETGETRTMELCADSEGEAGGFAQDRAFGNPPKDSYQRPCGSTGVVKVRAKGKGC